MFFFAYVWAFIIHNMPKHLFKTDTLNQFKFAKIDAKAGILYGVKMCSMGEAKGHGMWLNSEFIDSVVALGQQHKNGLRCRFGHPNMCNDSLGTYLGVYKNIRREDDTACGDLYLSDVAKNTPNGNLFDYVVNLASKDPGAFGSSIVFAGQEPTEMYKDEDGNEYGIANIDVLEFCDLVGQPAATDGLFSADSLAELVTEFLDENPKIFDLVEKKPEIFETFLSKYKFYKSNQPDLMFGKNKNKERLSSVKLQNGNILVFSGKFEEGAEVAPVDMESLPDGEYTIEDGRVITVEGGTIKAVKPKVEEPEPEAPMMSEDQLSSIVTAVTASLSKVINEKFAALEAKQTAIESEFAELKKGSQHTPPKGKAPINEPEKKFSIVEQIGAKTKEIFETIEKSRKA